MVQDFDEAEKWWRKMIEQSDGCAKLNLARYCNAADMGDAMAQYQLGKFYIGGEVVTNNPFRQTADNLWLAGWLVKGVGQQKVLKPLWPDVNRKYMQSLRLAIPCGLSFFFAEPHGLPRFFADPLDIAICV